MNSRQSAFSGPSRRPVFEFLEERKLLSVASNVISAPKLPTSPISIVSPTPVSPISTTPISALDKVVHAEVNEAFTAVVGKIGGLANLPNGYQFNGTIDWGDGSASSSATFVRESNGTIDIIGSHTYAKAGTDPITITVTREPPPGTLGVVVILGQVHTIASVIPASGLTLNETANTAFTVGLGSFASNLSSDVLRAVINWGDGTTSIGKLIAEPTAGPVGRFQVVGTHTYAQTRSYLVSVTVTTAALPPISTNANPQPLPIILVASFDSVIDVLPAVQVTPVTTA